jgi:hypothetical protein
MRTAAICPTCATYTNAVCVIYDGPYLSNLGISPTSSLDNALQQINSVAGTFEKTANKSTNITIDQSSNVKYPSVKAVYTWGNATFQPVLGFTPENVANKSTNTSLGTSNTLYPTQNAVKTYVDNAVSAISTPYKVYTASVLLNGSGADVTVYQNTIGDGSADGVNDIAWSKDFFGWLVTMSGSTAFPAGKTWIQSSNYISGGIAYNFYGFRTSNTVLTYRSIKPSDNSNAAGFAGSIFLEIRVYP